MLFFVKKIVAPFFYPVALTLVLTVAGVIVSLTGKSKRWSRILILTGVAILFFSGIKSTANLLIGPLERVYAPFDPAAHDEDFMYIVVLGGGHVNDPRLPITARINMTTLGRLAEGIRLYRLYPGSRLIFTGGSVWHDGSTDADVMREMAVVLGVDPIDIIVENESRDTGDHPRFVKPIVGDEPFILVTSASHMSRAMMHFTDYGMKPYPAPSVHFVRDRGDFVIRDLIPDANQVRKTEAAVHEYLGLLWAHIKRRL